MPSIFAVILKCAAYLCCLDSLPLWLQYRLRENARSTFPEPLYRLFACNHDSQHEGLVQRGRTFTYCRYLYHHDRLLSKKFFDLRALSPFRRGVFLHLERGGLAIWPAVLFCVPCSVISSGSLRVPGISTHTSLSSIRSFHVCRKT